jgi:hypothetical protein
MVRKELIETMAGKAESGARQGFAGERVAAPEDPESRRGAGSRLRQSCRRKQGAQKVMAAAAEILPANAVAGIGAGLVQFDGNVELAKP